MENSKQYGKINETLKAAYFKILIKLLNLLSADEEK